ncbi:DUF4199 domain-containing protein [Salegentibacter sp. F188]|uniref:DUF4199 domain-containing protein n=1 Tax=Autumnicola patrickiae TaxID=3075591 RepID=A0ABU3E400_9FLAO|nr:DUF4199 domain-containing protein [Salegentibacter sp. F188]MDT0690723.1 DUF4199 domain-containing protein [Salegentibacter sp. F188]
MNKISTPVKYGLGIAAALIIYFLILSIFGLHQYPAFSIFNMVILGAGLYFAITGYKKEAGAKFKFQQGFKVGITAGFLATAIFTVFFLVYATEIDQDFMVESMPVWVTDWSSTVGFLLVGVALAGFASTLVLTFAWVQLNKVSRNTEEGKEHTL